MLVNLNKVFDRDEKEKHLCTQFDFSAMDFGGGVEFKEPVSVCLDLKNGNRETFLKLSIKADGLCTCARCLDRFTRGFDVTRDFVVTPLILTEADPEVPVTADGVLDLQQWAYRELCLRLPTVFLCSEDCRGLCPVCGRPLREGCSCTKQKTVDPRLAILTQLLDNDD